MPSKPDPAETRDEVPAELVADYLRRHPDFLERHLDVMEQMTPPRRDYGDNVQDWQACLIERLRGQAATLRTEHENIIARMRRAHSLEDRVHAAALALIGTTDLDHLVDTAMADLPALLGVDVVAIAVEATPPDGRRKARGVRCIRRGAVSRMMKDRDVVVRSPARAGERIFGGASTLVRSEVLARFGGCNDIPPAVLALGSRDAARFRTGDPAGHYRFLVNVLDCCLHRKLGLPP